MLPFSFLSNFRCLRLRLRSCLAKCLGLGYLEVLTFAVNSERLFIVAVSLGIMEINDPVFKEINAIIKPQAYLAEAYLGVDTKDYDRENLIRSLPPISKSLLDLIDFLTKVDESRFKDDNNAFSSALRYKV